MSDRLPSSNLPPPEVRGMPRSDDAERGVLSCLLGSPEVLLERAQGTMASEWFYHVGNRLIFDELMWCYLQGKPVDLVLFNQHLTDRQLIEKAGGPVLLSELCDAKTTPAHWPYYTAILKEKYWLRSVIRECQELIMSTYDKEAAEGGAVEAVRGAVDRLFELLQAGTGHQKGFQPIKDFVPEVMDFLQTAMANKGHVTHGLATGFTDLDRRTMGLRNKQLIIVAARPAMGKSALALNIAEAIALANGHYDEFDQVPLPVGFVTAEMSGFELTCRSLLGMSGVNLAKCQTGMISKDKKAALTAVSNRLMSAPLYIFDTPALAIQELHQRVKRAVAKLGLRLLVVDYLQLFKSATKSAQNNRAVEVSEVAEGLKAIAKDCDIPVIACCQIGRSAEQRRDCKPMLSDLRESGGIDAAADIVIALWREGYYERQRHKGQGGGDDDEQEDEIADNQAQALLLKFRNGSTEPIHLHWDGPLTRFSSVTRKLFSNDQDQREPAAKAPVAPGKGIDFKKRLEPTAEPTLLGAEMNEAYFDPEN